MAAGLAAQLSLKPLARFVGFSVVGIRPEVMGIGPVAAVPRVLQRTGLSLADLDLIELNEAFAAQSLAVIRELGLDTERVNVNGGAIALGHPLGATGAKLTVQLVHELRRRGGALRDGDDVHWRRDGRGGDFRARGLNPEPACRRGSLGWRQFV
jgi:acetyl-CoA acyltransferase